MHARIAKHLNVRDEHVLEYRRENGEIVALVDYGTGGIKKFRLSLADLPVLEKFAPEEPKKPEPEKTMVEEVVKKASEAVQRATRRRRKPKGGE